ncbi:MAG: tetratricopeptide repeat protein [Planctomycetes bacterium]|nr:tetratricopeptide repeat protein [Planctomycetota bacterium]
MTTVANSFEKALQHHRKGDLERAESLYREIVRIDPGHASAYHLLGVAAHQQNHNQTAIDCLQKAIHIDPARAPAHFYLGNVLIEQSRLDEAADCFRQAIRIRPDYSEAYVRLGAVLLIQAEIDEAERYFIEALRLNPNTIHAWMNLGHIFKKRGASEKARNAYQRAIDVAPNQMLPQVTLGRFLHSQGKLKEAVSSLRKAVEIAPEDEKPKYYLANVYKDLGKYAEAVTIYREALEISPQFSAAYYELGNTHRHLKQYEQARDCYRQAIQINPDDYSVLLNLGNVLKAMDCIEESRACYRKVIEQIPDQPHWNLFTSTLCPSVFSHNDEIDAYRRQLHETLEQLAETGNLLTPQEISLCGCPPPYNLQFHGRDNRRLKEAYAHLFRNFVPPERPPTGVGKPKIGFVVTNGHEGVFLRYLLGVLERLNPEQFELVILCSAAGRERMQPEISSDSIRLLVTSHNLSDMLETIRDARFDVLYHWEVGSDVNNYFLPFFQLAPIQCTSLGVLETSGIRQIDYYLSPDIVEPADARDHYSETLLRTRTLLSYHTRLQLPSASKSREQFGFEKNQHLYFCPHKIQKFHPDMDPLLAGILQQDPQGIVVIPEDISGFAARNLRARFETTLAEVSHRIIFVPYQTLPDYLSLTAAADVLLDPIYYGGGLTSYDGFSLNQPTVTMPTCFARGRFTYGLYRQMGMTDCVATTSEEYVQQAVRLGSDRDYRDTILQELQMKSEVLFEDMTIVREYERILCWLVDEAKIRMSEKESNERSAAGQTAA